MKKILGVITARGGSKGIPGKNIKPLCGKPLLAYTIEAAQNSGIFDRLVLSTDDPAIAEIARQFGCEVPFMRPAELAGDLTPHLPVLKHTVETLKDREKYWADYVMLLQPTAPLRRARHIREAAVLIEKSGVDSVVSVVEIPNHFHPHWAVKKDEQGLGALFVSGEPIRSRIPRRQHLETAYSHNGAIYLFKTELLFNHQEPNFYGERVAVYPMEEKYSVNIDDLFDWDFAEWRVAQLEAEHEA